MRVRWRVVRTVSRRGVRRAWVGSHSAMRETLAGGCQCEVLAMSRTDKDRPLRLRLEDAPEGGLHRARLGRGPDRAFVRATWWGSQRAAVRDGCREMVAEYNATGGVGVGDSSLPPTQHRHCAEWEWW